MIYMPMSLYYRSNILRTIPFVHLYDAIYKSSEMMVK